LAGVSTGASYLVDRFELRNNNVGTFTISQDTDAPAGFKTSSKLLATTADASLAASDFLFYRTKLEGQALQGLKYGSASAMTTTLSFWVKSTLTGTYIVFIDNSLAPGGAKAISRSYTINAANTWEKKSFTISGDTASAINNDNLVGLGLNFVLAAGSDRTSGTLQTNWSSITNANTCVGQVNLAGTINNSWQMTGMQLEIGDVATEFQTATGTIQGELAACQRYFYQNNVAINDFATGFAPNTTTVRFVMQNPVQMRTLPASASLVIQNLSIAVARTGGTATGGTWSISYGTLTTTEIQYVHGTGVFTAGDGMYIYGNNANSYIAWSAEL
jgi:hypothetical protein